MVHGPHPRADVKDVDTIGLGRDAKDKNAVDKDILPIYVLNHQQLIWNGGC
jgi:hypothetical protein